jgi:hypothetical protein
MTTPRNIDNPKFARAVELFRLAFLMRQRLYMENELARKRYGMAGNVVSGGHCDGWPQEAKQASRRRNRAANRLTDAAMRARPPRVQIATMRTLMHEVTTREIRRQHGIGQGA